MSSTTLYLLLGLLLLLTPFLLFDIMGLFSTNHFDVAGKTVLITGGSQGLGRSVGRILAEKGASVIIVARTEEKLKEACQHAAAGAKDPQRQKFSYISADLTSSSECNRIIEESSKRNNGSPPDIVWCCAGTSLPTLIIDSPPESFSNQMTSNYLSAAWTAQAVVRSWLKAGKSLASQKKPVYHLVFTSSVLALYSVAGYGPYSPSKCALRSLSDTLSQELELYHATAHMKVHTVFPATIYTEAYEAENRIKSDMTKMLEEDDEGQTPEACAQAAIVGLEYGRELVHTTFLARLLMCGVLGGSRRASGFAGLLDGLLGLLMLLIEPWVRWFYDLKVKNWADTNGQSGMRKE